MSITSYAGLLDELTRLIDGEDTSTSDIPAQTLGLLVNLGERRIYREVRSRFNEKAWGITVTSNLAAIPADFEAPSVVHFGALPLLPVSEEQLLEYLDSGETGDTRCFAVAGSNLQFFPAVGDGTTVQGRYFYRLADLSASTLPTNTLFANANDLFIYAALAESGPYFGPDNAQKVPVWEAKYKAIRDQINTQHNRAAFNAGRMRRSAAVPVLR